MFKTLFYLTLVTTLISMGIVGKMGMLQQEKVGLLAPPTAIMISNHGIISFPDRIPNAEIVDQLRQAVQSNNIETLNALLVEHNFYVVPHPKSPILPTK